MGCPAVKAYHSERQSTLRPLKRWGELEGAGNLAGGRGQRSTARATNEPGPSSAPCAAAAAGVPARARLGAAEGTRLSGALALSTALPFSHGPLAAHSPHATQPPSERALWYSGSLLPYGVLRPGGAAGPACRATH